MDKQRAEDLISSCSLGLEFESRASCANSSSREATCRWKTSTWMEGVKPFRSIPAAVSWRLIKNSGWINATCSHARNGWTDERMDGRKDGRMDREMVGLID